MPEETAPVATPKNTWLDVASYSVDKLLGVAQLVLLTYITSKQPSQAPSVVTTPTGGTAVVSAPATPATTGTQPAAPATDVTTTKLDLALSRLDVLKAQGEQLDRRVQELEAKVYPKK